ncbi:LamG-like jellyroll fold domain-containing protein [Actinoplanes sp. CA-252034]|uniref:LamG-like jellyroll fold domain-containing protein n=1 Tax=Actinoplanes sp. CA-252034 TaxID=3239906 RepID=UPI003D96F8C3
MRAAARCACGTSRPTAATDARPDRRFGAASASAPTVGLDRWHHLDATHRQVRLYIDGAPAEWIDLSSAWQPRQAAGSLLVCRSTTQAGPDGWLQGDVDDFEAYRGALSDADVRRLFIERSVCEVP